MIPETPLLVVQQNMFVANPEGVEDIREFSRRDSQSLTMSLPSYTHLDYLGLKPLV